MASRYQALIVFGLFSGVLSAQEPVAVTLAEAVKMAVGHHQDVAQAHARADALKGQVREVRAQALPEISFVSNATRLRDPSLLNASGLDKFPEELRNALIPNAVNLFDYGITVKQPLYTRGKVGTALKLASIEAEGALSEIDRAEQDVAVATVKAYYNLMWAERHRQIVGEEQDQRKQHAAMARTLFKNGVATEVDMLRSEVAVANGEPELVRADGAIRLARASLNYYLGRPLDFATRPAAEFEQKEWEQNDLAQMEKEALRRRPELQRLRIAERSAAAQVQLADAENRMRADFASSYGLAARMPENLVNSQFVRWNVGVNFTLPVFDGFKRSGLVWQATANERTTRLERQKVEQQVQLAIQQGYVELNASAQTIAAARATVNQAEKVLAMTQNNYKYGAATTLDVLDAQTAVSVARSNLLLGLRNYCVARADLRWTLGLTPWE